MYVTDELKTERERIVSLNHYVEKLYIKLFFEKNEKFNTEYEQNENDISIIQTEIKLNKILATLDFLQAEHLASIEYFISLSNKEPNE